MIKKNFTPATIAILIWCIGHLLITQYYYEYLNYYLILCILIAIPLLVFDTRKKLKTDKINNTDTFKLSIYRMAIVAVVLVVVFFITKQNPM